MATRPPIVGEPVAKRQKALNAEKGAVKTSLGIARPSLPAVPLRQVHLHNDLQLPYNEYGLLQM